MGKEKYTYKSFKNSNMEKFGNSPPILFWEISLQTSQVKSHISIMHYNIFNHYSSVFDFLKIKPIYIWISMHINTYV